jgi:hypothetical protein
MRSSHLARQGSRVLAFLKPKWMPMSERLTTLTAARERMTEDRDAFAKVLAGPNDRERSERARAKFVELQVLIDTIDRAIEGELRRARNAPQVDAQGGVR